MFKTIEIRPALPRTRAVPDKVLACGIAVATGMNGNKKYSASPVDLTTFTADLATFQGLIAASLDGSKQVIAQRNNQQRIIAQKLVLLGHYVSITADGDMAVFLSSGFQSATVNRVPPGPLAQPTIRKIAHGKSGEVLVSIAPLAKARSYELRYAPLAAGLPGSWTTVAVSTVRSATPVDGLTPGTLYAFQVRALGRLGFTDWTDSANFMCT